LKYLYLYLFIIILLSSCIFIIEPYNQNYKIKVNNESASTIYLLLQTNDKLNCNGPEVFIKHKYYSEFYKDTLAHDYRLKVEPNLCKELNIIDLNVFFKVNKSSEANFFIFEERLLLINDWSEICNKNMYSKKVHVKKIEFKDYNFEFDYP